MYRYEFNFKFFHRGEAIMILTSKNTLIIREKYDIWRKITATFTYTVGYCLN